jgi:hypothetical protein
MVQIHPPLPNTWGLPKTKPDKIAPVQSPAAWVLD